jgi:hypothetical protein
MILGGCMIKGPKLHAPGNSLFLSVFHVTKIHAN